MVPGRVLASICLVLLCIFLCLVRGWAGGVPRVAHRILSTENVQFLFILRGFRTSGTFKNVAGDHIYHLAKYGLMGSDPDRFYER